MFLSQDSAGLALVITAVSSWTMAYPALRRSSILRSLLVGMSRAGILLKDKECLEREDHLKQNLVRFKAMGHPSEE